MLLGALLAGLGCMRSSGSAGSGRDAPEPAPADTVVTLERTICFGTCPSYTVAILEDGTVRYQGRRFVATEGAATAEISPDSLARLVDAFRAIDYFALRSSYVSGDPCEGQWTDLPTAVTSLRLDGRRKQVTHYHGCRGFEKKEALTALENKIDAVAGTARWVEGSETSGG